MGITKEQQTQKLLTLKALEDAKGRSRHPRSPAVFRETALDTHKTLASDFDGPDYIMPRRDYPTRIGSATVLEANRQKKAALEALLRTSQFSAPGEVRSVFVPTAQQLPVCLAAGERRANVAASEWALLDTLGVTMFDREREREERAVRVLQRQQRVALDGQMAALQQTRREAEAAKAAERQAVLSGVFEHHARTRQRLDSQRVANMQLRKEREGMLAEARAVREASVAARREEEARLVAQERAKLDADRAAAAERAAALRERVARDMMENEVQLVKRRQAEAAQKAADAETSKRMAEMMLSQERAREGVAEAIQAKVMARAGRAGTKALDDKRERIEREDRLIAEATREAERREAEREAADAAKRARQKAEMFAVNEELKRAKAEREAAAREAEQRARAAAEIRSAAERAEAERRQLESRERAALTKRIVASQAEEARIQAKYADIFMTEQERKLNRELLDEAFITVGEPRQLSVIIK
ncbi:hypothetical protein Agub_g10323 [Astrephomene gubernaculifera]|uniref:Uncharacterized protein n=1 Tax=Astrephomene gubernaculifera TaxID=47775 RepID=A0AAD3HPV4_9CHLO|nr:hypothetical protein Agub_g10323 [Astrephomene gubernaculifera]